MTEREAIEILYVLATNNKTGKYKGSYEEAFDILINKLEKQQHIIEGKEALIETQSHNEEVYMKALEKQEKRIKDLEAKLNAKEILMNTLPEETDFIILTKEDYSRNYTEKIQQKDKLKQMELQDKIWDLEAERDKARIACHLSEKENQAIIENNNRLVKIINLMAEQLTTPEHNKEWVIDYYKNTIQE